MGQRSEWQITEEWGGHDKPLVSVLCLTYNHSKYIQDAINGFLMQETDFPFEIIIHDDFSTDETPEIVETYRLQYPNLIKYIVQNENQYSKGRRIIEVATPLARGKYIALCEGDDYWTDPLKLAKQVSFLEQHHDYVIAYHRSQPFDDTGDFSVDFGGETSDLTSFELQKTVRSIYTLTACFRNVIKDFPPEFSTARFGDMFLWSLLGQYGKGKYLEGITPAKYRVHQDGIFSLKSLQVKFEMLLATHAALFAYYSRIGDHKLASHFKFMTFKSCILASVSAGRGSSLLHIAVKTKRKITRLFG